MIKNNINNAKKHPLIACKLIHSHKFTWQQSNIKPKVLGFHDKLATVKAIV